MNRNITDFEWHIVSTLHWLLKDETSDKEYISYLQSLLKESRKVTKKWDSIRFYDGEPPTLIDRVLKTE